MFLASSINRVIPSSACRDLDGNHLTRRRSQRLFRAAYEQRRGAAGPCNLLESRYKNVRRPLRWYAVRVPT